MLSGRDSSATVLAVASRVTSYLIWPQLPELTGKPRYGYSRGHRALEVAAIAVFFAALVCLGYRTVDAMEGADHWPVGISMIGGFILADFLSGVAHWAGDTVGDEQTPFLGPNFVKPFRMHHVDPKDITRHDFIETNGNSSIVAVPVLLVALFIMPNKPGLHVYLTVLLASAAFFIFCTNQFHKWAHADRAPRVVRWLQRVGIILSPEHHAIHHAAPHDKYYCITVGWMNPILQKLRFFRACEAVIGWVAPRMLHLAERQRNVD
jgi:ubiquitin-conjugating enzyme E2 variant